jgi:hypothetical protein
MEHLRHFGSVNAEKVAETDPEDGRQWRKMLCVHGAFASLDD